MGENLENEQVRALVLLGELEPANSSYEQALAMCGEGAESTCIANRIHRQRSVGRDGAKIAYYEHGSGRTTLMFLNPAFYGISTFQPLVERFCQDYHIITLDPRGSGDSNPIPDDYSMRDHMEDIRAVIDDVGATSVVGVGISRGGNPLLMMDTTYPGKLEKIVTIGMPVDDRGPDTLFPKAPDPRLIQAIQERDFETFFRSFIQIFNPEPGLEAYNADLLKVYLQLPEKTILRFLAPDPEMNVVPLFGKIKVPVLLIHGMIDGNVDPKHTNHAAERIHNSQMYEFPNAGHNPWLTAMGEFCEILRQFVETGIVEGAKRGGVLTHG